VTANPRTNLCNEPPIVAHFARNVPGTWLQQSPVNPGGC
jgi:hypothetical protein